MNVYVGELARHLARSGALVDVWTRADEPGGPVALPGSDGRARVVPVPVAGPASAAKEDLPARLPEFAAAVLARLGAVEPGRPPYDVLHGHYWLSGEVASILAAAWHVPVVQTMHTLAAAKDAAGGPAEPGVRRAGERHVVAAAAALVCSTADEAATLVRDYGAEPARVHVVPPGVDTALFAPGDGLGRAADRRAAGLPERGRVVLFVGRLQAHKGPDLLLEAVAAAVADRPDLRGDLTVAVLGGPSGPGGGQAAADLDALAARLGIAGLVLRRGPVPRDELPRWYRAADVVAVPSRHESFGLVALEAQACGTPVLAARVGGLPAAVADGVSGVLVEGRDPRRWAGDLVRLLDDPGERARLGAGARRHAERHSWRATAAATAAVYERVLTAGEGGGGEAAAVGVGFRGGAGGGGVVAAVSAAVRGFLDAAGVEHVPGTRPGEVVASVPGERRRSVTVSLLAGSHTLSAAVFVCRRPEDDPAAVHDLLLRRNARLPGVAFAVDRPGDVYLVGRVPVAALLGPAADDVLDSLLGALVRTVEESFDEILARGFASAIRAEHAWRTARGLPADNLAAFHHVLDDS
jgi:D-inositol-3-phosphate glycosyltransferase